MITTGMGSKKIEGSDNWRAIFSAHNDSVEASDDHLDAIQDGLAIVANGDTHPAVASGQYVYVRNHDTLAEGLYKAAAAIAEDALLNTSNLVADGAGGLNDLKSGLDTLNSNIATYNFGSNTVANIQAAMVTYAGELADNTTKNIAFSVSAASTPFVITSYVGTLTRLSATRLIVNVYQSMNSAIPIFGKYKDGTWEWNTAAISNKMIVQAANSSGQADASGCYRLYVNPSNHVATIFDGSGTRLGYFAMQN